MNRAFYHTKIIIFLCFFPLFFFTKYSIAFGLQVAFSELGLQVDTCKQALNVQKLTPAGSCFGDNTYFIENNTTDGIKILGYFPLSDHVDAVYHCENVDKSKNHDSQIELIIHNRKNGNTCFFEVQNPSISGGFTSLDDCSTFGSCSAENEWNIPGAHRCVTCHKNGGPYFISTDKGAEAMAHFGLLNNQHVTNWSEGNANYKPIHYNASTQEDMLTEVYKGHPAMTPEAFNRSSNSFDGLCGGACHNFVRANDPQFKNLLSNMAKMPPVDKFSPYRWINKDSPDASGDWEYLDSANNNPKFAALIPCSNPSSIQAHLVGSPYIISSNSEYALLSGSGHLSNRFNPIDGLQCRKSNMPNGVCADYEVNFYCSGTGTWTGWRDKDNPSQSGDYEYPPKDCDKPTRILARHAGGGLGSGVTYATYGEGHLIVPSSVEGFPDRLSFFDHTGIGCKNSDQDDGKCGNYAVRYMCP